MASLNIVQLIGYLGAEPKIERLQSGNVKATLSVATTEKGYTTKSGSVIPDRTEWHIVTFWGGIAEVCEKYLHKASCVYVEGKMRTRSWDDSNGVKHYMTEVEGSQLQMLDRKPVDPSGQSAPSNPQPAPANRQGYATPTHASTEPETDDLPF